MGGVGKMEDPNKPAKPVAKPAVPAAQPAKPISQVQKPIPSVPPQATNAQVTINPPVNVAKPVPPQPMPGAPAAMPAPQPMPAAPVPPPMPAPQPMPEAPAPKPMPFRDPRDLGARWPENPNRRLPQDILDKVGALKGKYPQAEASAPSDNQPLRDMIQNMLKRPKE